MIFTRAVPAHPSDAGQGPADLSSLLRSLSSRLPPDLQSRLGDMPWEARVSDIEARDDKTVIRFFSDGLDLAAKSRIEAFVRETLALEGGAQKPEVTLYFTRKNPTTAPQPPRGASARNEPPKPAAAQASPATSPAAAGRRSIPGVRRIVAVASGKGGVGKSTVSVNLAIALHNQGYKVGILDADIYGPSLPLMLGIREDPKVNESNKIVPPMAHGLKVMSFGFFAPEDSAVIWRGPMVMKALQQFFYDVDWGDLDYLVIDLPPGTGDAQLTIVQSLPLSGAVIVTTPQNVALLDAVKGVVMFRKTEVPIVGIVENMSTFHCPACGTESHVFGEGGAERMSGKFDVPVLGAIPLMPDLREAGDAGVPLTTKNGHPVRVRFSEVAEKVVTRLISLEKERAEKTPVETAAIP